MDRLIQCYDCKYSFHTYCLDRVLKHIPKGVWVCPPCRKKKKEVDTGDEDEIVREEKRTK